VNGYLTITAEHLDPGLPNPNYDPTSSDWRYNRQYYNYTSSSLITQNKHSWAYGKFESSIKIDIRSGSWPAWWTLGTNVVTVGWPACGEIDVMESRGNRDLRDGGGNSVGVDVIASTMHWGPDFNNNNWWRTSWPKKINSGDYSDDFHVYSVERTPDHITFRVDDQEVGSVYPPGGGFWELAGFGPGNIWAGGDRMAPFDKPFYLMINVAVGGRFFDNFNNGGYPRPWDWNSGHPMLQFYEQQGRWQATWDRPQLEVDYVRVYEL